MPRTRDDRGWATPSDLKDDGLAGASPCVRDDRPAWHDEALCRTAPRSIDWFAHSPSGIAAAQKVCERCPVRADCLRWSIQQSASLKGVWAGLTPRDRQELRPSKHRAA